LKAEGVFTNRLLIIRRARADDDQKLFAFPRKNIPDKTIPFVFDFLGVIIERHLG
jgi:hypothetical protein